MKVTQLWPVPRAVTAPSGWADARPQVPVERRGIRGRHRDGEEVLRAPLIVGADGVHSTVAQRLQARRRMVMPTPIDNAQAVDKAILEVVDAVPARRSTITG